MRVFLLHYYEKKTLAPNNIVAVNRSIKWIPWRTELVRSEFWCCSASSESWMYLIEKRLKYTHVVVSLIHSQPCWIRTCGNIKNIVKVILRWNCINIYCAKYKIRFLIPIRYSMARDTSKVGHHCLERNYGNKFLESVPGDLFDTRVSRVRCFFRVSGESALPHSKRSTWRGVERFPENVFAQYWKASRHISGNKKCVIIKNSMYNTRVCA